MTRDDLAAMHHESVVLEMKLKRAIPSGGVSTAEADALISAWTAQKRSSMELAKSVRAREALERRSRT